MSAFYSNQPDRNQIDAAEKGQSPDNDQPCDKGQPHDEERLFDEETSMSFPTTDEAGEPIQLDAPPDADDPTPEEIELRSQEIRGRWSDRVKKKRHLRAPMKWNVPSVPVADIDFPGS